jgi:hypothetical protein
MKEEKTMTNKKIKAIDNKLDAMKEDIKQEFSKVKQG